MEENRNVWSVFGILSPPQWKPGLPRSLGNGFTDLDNALFTASSGKPAEAFFFSPTDVHHSQLPRFVFNLTILDGNIFTTYFTPSRFIQCTIEKIMTQFSKEGSIIKNINDRPTLFENSSGNRQVEEVGGKARVLLHPGSPSFHLLISASLMLARLSTRSSVQRPVCL